jgi:hypothetical protein
MLTVDHSSRRCTQGKAQYILKRLLWDAMPSGTCPDLALQLWRGLLITVCSTYRQSPAAPPPATGFLAKSFPVMELQRCLAVLRLPVAAASKPWGRTLCALHAAEGEDGIKAIAVTAAGNLFEYSVQVWVRAVLTCEVERGQTACGAMLRGLLLCSLPVIRSRRGVWLSTSWIEGVV